MASKGSQHSLLWDCCIFSVGGLEEISFLHPGLPSVGDCHSLKILDKAIFGSSHPVNKPTAILQFPSAVDLVCTLTEAERVFLEHPREQLSSHAQYFLARGRLLLVTIKVHRSYLTRHQYTETGPFIESSMVCSGHLKTDEQQKL